MVIEREKRFIVSVVSGDLLDARVGMSHLRKRGGQWREKGECGVVF